ncbi:SusC/RagA family TonB-linked outer membrane protein [Chitinophaga sp. Cy-1792]|uniref:SusC/RagA family TonB-linked outer membrane protein n=1 Tax=Chitinophaga sp. Cy-1792 TaxID=2608339 RepID=UPI001423DD0E|nr:SusC/RagA family TonB-linked outer membrane protein [Chitinophaga sp. Cy-1792]NIG52954.1 SusC/RagA family TonB-linked outer membrane protein [Chitinophaga sp. Cy-1792]
MKKIYLTFKGWFGRSVACSLLMTTLALPAGAQNLFQRISVNVRNQSISNVLYEIERQTNLNFVYDGDIASRQEPVSITAKNMAVQEVLKDVFKNDFTYTVIGDKVIVRNAETHAAKVQQEKTYSFTGRVVLNDRTGENTQAPGVTIQVKGTNKGTQTDPSGKFTITVKEDDILVFRYVGYKPLEYAVGGRKSANITLNEDVSKIKEVVVNGIFERSKESFSGSVSNYTARELKQIGNQNIIQSLRSLDPAFTVFENNLTGSNPNVLPNLEIRGKTSVIGMKETFGTDPNQPLFILDGFEADLRTVVDLDMNRVESVTILKDAASTAIYGSKAANGVVVIETKKPKPGQLRVNYVTDNSVTVPDLRDYNLMNASEKLAFEYAVGKYKQYLTETEYGQRLDSVYNAHLRNVAQGVNTYWLSEPLQTGITTGHSLYIEGGDNDMRYSAGVNYKKISGVMKGSGRDQGGGNLKLMYRKKKFMFSNNLSVSFYTADESPYGSFSSFAYANPYYKKRNDDGSVSPFLEIYYDANDKLDTVVNPLYNATLNSRNRTKDLQLINNFMSEWSVTKDWRVRARLGLTKDDNNTEVFSPSRNTDFYFKPIKERGYYQKVSNNTFGYDGELTVTFGKIIANKHQLNAVGGWNFQSRLQTREGYESSGFPDDMDSPGFAAAYKLNGRPITAESTKRNTSFYFNGGYVYDRRYVLEANYRKDGASIYGLDRLFTNSWSVGASWNIHNEAFMEQYRNVSMLKLRASVGTPGNQNFPSYQTYTLYTYNLGLSNEFGTGVNINSFGNPFLKWQKTLDKNIGLDLVMLNNRIKFNGDYYNRETDPLVAVFNVPVSTGTTTTSMNLGKQVGNGYNFQLAVSPIMRTAERVVWTINFSAKHENARYEGMGTALAGMNKENQGLNTTRYYDGGSPTAIWGVRSAGIDPGTGNEIFIKKDGTHTFTYDSKDEVVLGDTRPKLDGIIGTNFFYKGITLGVYLRYRYGGDAFNEAVYDKVDNISYENVGKNADRRAYYDRWLYPGDVAKYRKITMTADKNALIANTSKMTSRFVQRENTLAGESINMGYDFPIQMIRKYGLTSLRLNAYTNDIFRFSTIRNERGLDYPFANTVAFSINVGF